MEAHEQGVIHRDIKPENVLLTKWGDVKVGDFGIAKAAESSTHLTRTGFNPGTVHYMSPEQLRGEEATPGSDLYSLGVVLYKMLAGRLPFEGKTVSEIQNKHLHERVRPLAETNPNVEVPERVEAVTMRLLAKDPKERYPDAAALMADIEAAKESPGAVVDDESPTMPPRGRARDDVVSTTTVEVPNLAGRKPDQARGILADAGLSLGSRREAISETVPKGDIVEQTPPMGTVVQPGSSVNVTVSSGALTVEVPDLAGLNRSEAGSTLAQAGLKLGTRNEAPDNDTPEGEIIRQDPVARIKVEQGSSVSITVSSGPRKVTEPFLLDRGTPEAGQALSTAGSDVAGLRTRQYLKRGITALVRALAVVLVLTAFATPAYLWASSQYYLAFDDEGVVVVYQGLPYAPFGYTLNDEVRRTDLQREDILEAYRGQIDNRELKTEDEANEVVRNLEARANQSTSDPESR